MVVRGVCVHDPPTCVPASGGLEEQPTGYGLPEGRPSTGGGMSIERRRFPRAAQTVPATCRSIGDFSSAWASATVLSLSAVGTRLRTEVLFEAGTEVEVRLQPPGFREALVLRARVVWQKIQDAGMVEYGIDLSGIPPDQQQQIDQLVVFLGRGRA